MDIQLQGSVLSPLLFIIVIEALTGLPWKLQYADDLVIIADSIEELVNITSAWKRGLESKGPKVNVKKTMVRGVCWKGVSSNFVFCHGCSH